MPEFRKIPTTSLQLDESNPRLGKPESGGRWTQAGILEHFASQQKLHALAQDIAEKGLNPSKRPIAMRDPSHSKSYIVLEGNRRIAAARLISNPKLAGGSAKYFQKLSRNGFQLPGEIECVIVKSRDEADHWISLEHGLGKDGTSTLEWGPREKSRYQERVSGEGRYTKSTALLDTLTESRIIDVSTARKVPITTLDRLLNDPNVRAKLKLDFDDLSIPGTQLEYLKRIVSDLSSGAIKVDKVKTKGQRESYIDSVLSHPDAGNDNNKARPAPATTSGRRQRAQSPAHTRRHLIPTDFKPTMKNKRQREIYAELRQLDVEKYPNAVSVLFRTFFEIAIWNFYEARNLDQSQKLSPKIRKVAKTLAAEGKIVQSVETVILRATDDEESIFSIKSLHQYVHGPYDHPSPKNLKRNWDQFQPFLEALFNE